MSSASHLFAELARHPLHVQLMHAVIVGSGLACVAVVAIGWLAARLKRRELALEGLPPLPPTFPYALDQAYTALFMLFILWGAITNLHPSETASGKSGFGWGALIMGVAVQIAIYLPMLIRYSLLHPWRRPGGPWQRYLLLPVLVWAGLYLSIALLETSGFSYWLIRVTECPEHQDLVLLFSRGDVMQRLYIIICAVFIAPVAEECCFRGFLYSTLRRWGGRAAATVASALLFGAIHASLAQMVPLTLFGIVQCVVYEKARSLWLPIAVHMLFNTTSLIATSLMLP